MSAAHIWFQGVAALGLVAGTVAVTGLAVGCSLMVRETRMAVRNLAEEARLAASPPNAP